MNELFSKISLAVLKGAGGMALEPLSVNHLNALSDVCHNQFANDFHPRANESPDPVS